jgi:hypothetical protein
LWKIKQENLQVERDKKLGSGAFADVYSGYLIGDAGIKRVYKSGLLVSNFHDCKVAVKALPPFADDWSKNDFQQV